MQEPVLQILNLVGVCGNIRGYNYEERRVQLI